MATQILPVDTYYYDILDVPIDADHVVIKKAYKKLAIKHHPDKSKASDAEEKFKAISEAYQILGTRELRIKYDKYGRSKDLQPPDGFADPKVYFQCMYGGAGFKPIIGDMAIGQFFGQEDRYYAKGQKPPTLTEAESRQLVMEHAEQLQNDRVKTLAGLLGDKLSQYTKDHHTFATHDNSKRSTPTSFEKTIQQEAAELKTESYGNSLLAVVGRVYSVKAKQYIGKKRGVLPGVIHTLKEKRYITKELWKTVKCCMDAQVATDMANQAETENADDRLELEDLNMLKSYQALWQMAKFEIDATLRKVCDVVLQDKTLDPTERMLRAEGLLLLGGIYASNSQIPENENIIVRLK